MEKGPAYHHGDLRLALLDAAEKELQKDPNCQLSLRALAGAIGVSATAPHAHFRTKSDLLAALATRGFARLRDELLLVPVDKNQPHTTLTKLAGTYIAFGASNIGLYRLMFTTGVSLTENAELREASRAAYDVLRDFIRDVFPGEGDEGVNQTALTAWALVHGFGSLLNEGRISEDIASDRSPHALARIAATLLTQMDPSK